MIPNFVSSANSFTTHQFETYRVPLSALALEGTSYLPLEGALLDDTCDFIHRAEKVQHDQEEDPARNNYTIEHVVVLEMHKVAENQNSFQSCNRKCDHRVQDTKVHARRKNRNDRKANEGPEDLHIDVERNVVVLRVRLIYVFSLSHRLPPSSVS